MGELTGPSSTDSPRSSPHSSPHSPSSIIPQVSSAFLYNSMISATHANGKLSQSPPPPNLMEDDEMDSCSTTFYRSSTGETRKAREFIPDSKKDEKYWERRRKNNEAAKRSREKRRQNDAMMEHEIAELKQQNEILMRENCALLREIASLKGKDPACVETPTPPIQQIPSSANGVISTLDLIGLQRLLTTFSNNSANGITPLPAMVDHSVVNGSGLDETPLDLSGGKIPMMVKQSCLPSPDSQSVGNVNQIGKLTELAVLTSTSPQITADGSYSTNRPQSVSWNSTPNPITPPACNGLQALISAAALTASPLMGETNCNIVTNVGHTTNPGAAKPTWDIHQASPCLPLGFQPLPQQKMEASSDLAPRRRNGSIRSPSSQYDDERYRERRRKNNEAVRRCRENKRARLSMRDEVTGRLQSDNILLRSKLDGLNSEVRALRHLLLAGQQQANGQQVVNEEQPQVENSVECQITTTEPQQIQPDEEKPQLKYALPKKGIPRVPTNASVPINHLSSLKRRITLPPTFNPLASIQFEGASGITN
ncbi:unnamed protein product [Rodentolepis nana]|uniref:BZIP domain-containing protein n=1 Tax=Rodentolepis nana TaxID=102285 RepID=A0A0R3T326_RODNA|nr:unnamed protein product [Rodentolepis nana]